MIKLAISKEFPNRSWQNLWTQSASGYVNLQVIRERELGPRFPAPNSFEYVYGMKWKELYEHEKNRRAQLEEELKEARRRLEADMELAYQDYQAQMLREGRFYCFFFFNILVPK